MPKSFLLKRFPKSSKWLEGEGVASLTVKGNDQSKDYSSTNINGIDHRASGWDSRQDIGNVFYVGIEWNKMNPQKQINSQHYSNTSEKPNKQDFVNHMIYHDITNPMQLNNGERKGDASKRTPTKPNIKSDSHRKQTYKCGQCGKVFKTKYTLTIHLKMPSHTGARPFVCAICGKGFRLSSTLCRHKIIHTSNKPHRCQTCGKAFNRSSTLKTHQRTHSDTKEFSCHICNKGFHQKGNLRNHLLIHSGEKPYKCSLCKKAFNKLSNLKFHMHVHTDNRPYRCRYCKESFSRRCELKEHISNCGQSVIDNSSAVVGKGTYH